MKKMKKREVVEKDEMERKKKDVVREKGKKKEVEKKVSTQHLPYPHAPSKKDKERQYARFLELFNKLQIDIPFSEALEQMSAYAKFMKDILSKKKRINDEETIQLDANCNAIIQRRLPKKEQDPGRVTLPVAIGTINVSKALLDLGLSINLMTLSVAKRVGDLCIKRTRMTLQLADKSLAKPLGMAEDVLVKVDKFVFPTDFVVMDIEDDEALPLLLGRNFMQMARMMIDLDDNIMKVKVDNEEVTFNIREAIKHSKDKGACFKMDVTEEVIMTTRKQFHNRTPLESALTDALNTIGAEEARDIEECLKELDSMKEIPPHQAKLEELKEESKEEPKVDDTKVELKVLPSHLKYVFLENDGTKPVIISSSLSINEDTKLVEILKSNKEAIGWQLSDLKGISPSYSMHKIMMEEDFKPVAQSQRRLNPTMKEVVRKEMVKLLEAGMIYPISDSAWVSPVQVVPKKGGMTVITNEKNELIPTRTVTGWRM